VKVGKMTLGSNSRLVLSEKTEEVLRQVTKQVLED